MFVLLEYIDHFLLHATLTDKDSQLDCNSIPIMLELCQMLSGTYYAIGLGLLTSVFEGLAYEQRISP